MILRNFLPHMVNASVKVNENVYLTNEEGVTEVDVQEDIDKLLLNRGIWKRYVARAPVEPGAPKGKPVEPPQAPIESVTESTAGSDPPGDSEPVVPPVESPGDVKPPVAPNAPVAKPPVKEWPDPTMKHTLKQLRETADAYQVGYNDKTPKAELIGTIMGAMYEE